MKRFSDFKKSVVKKVFEQEVQIEEQPVNIPQEEPQPTENVANSPVKFFSKLFEARQMAHIFHLQVKGEMGSGWEHSALGEFYSSILDLTDEIIETYQGQYGIVEGYETIDPSQTAGQKSLDYIKATANFIRNERKVIPAEDTHLHNIVDEIVALCYKTIYKLTNLK